MVGVVGSSPIAPTNFLEPPVADPSHHGIWVWPWRLFRFGGRLRVVGHKLNHVILGIDHH